MTLEEILRTRRAVRRYTDEAIDADTVRHCIDLARLAPTSSNMQLWECYHVTDPDTIRRLVPACLDQTPVSTAQQLVVFVTRRDLFRRRAAAVLDFERGNVTRNSPPERQAKRIRDREMYYGRLIPFIYANACGLLGLLRKTLVLAVGLFRPITRQVSEADMRVVVHKSCALVVQTFMLAMTDAGYDTCPMGGFDSLRVKRILRLPRRAEVNMIISCGIRDEGRGVWGERFRVPMEEIYHRI